MCHTLIHPKRVAPTAFQLIFGKNAASKLHPVFVNYSIIHFTLARSHLNGNLTSVHKKDSKEPVENYRHISLLAILGKVLERGVCFRLYNHIEHLITKFQHGFLRQRSCVTQLLPVLHTIGQSLDKNTHDVRLLHPSLVLNGSRALFI